MRGALMRAVSRPVPSNFARRFARGAATDAFTALEHKMWQAGAAAYSDSFAKVTGMATNALLDNANVTLTSPMAVSIVERTPLESREGGLRVLDVATGPGMVADAAAARGHAEVVALDFSSEMIKRAQAVVERHPEGVVQLVEGDAAALPMPDASFDAVTIGFGLLHLPRPHLALAEAFRVLKPGGYLAYSVWSQQDNAAFRILNEALAAHGSPEAKLPGVEGDEAPLPFFHFADEENARKALQAAGFAAASVRTEVVSSAASLKAEHDLYEMFATATARSRALLEQQSPEQLEAIKAAMADAVGSEFRGVWNVGRGIMNVTHGAAEFPGAEDKVHTVSTFGSKYGGAAAGTQWLGGRYKFMIPMPSIVVSARKPETPAEVKKPAEAKKPAEKKPKKSKA